MGVNLIWITPDTDKTIGYLARVSNPMATPDDPTEKLIQYLLDHKHVSPFEMASACVEIETTRDIARQILRHRSFHFQEFSQRYSKVLESPLFCNVRLQDTKNRQNSVPTGDRAIKNLWSDIQSDVWGNAYSLYEEALDAGIAKELARKLLPEGLTPTRMYMAGTIRDWLFYLSVRLDPSTQLEHRAVAENILKILEQEAPVVFSAARKARIIND